MAKTRVYPTNAAHGGSATLTGSGNAADVFTFAEPVAPVVQNDTAATIYVALNGQATQGDEAIAAGAERVFDDLASSVGIYGAATTHVNGTATGGIVVYGVGDVY